MKCFLFVTCALLLSSVALFASNSPMQETPYTNSREQTLALIKPNAVSAHHIGEIIADYEQHGLTIVGLKMVNLSKQDAEAFYAMHKDRPFYKDLTSFMSSGPIVAIALQGPSAVAKNRELLGATDPAKANENTLRRRFGQNITQNGLHGSDSVESARNEISFFFSQLELTCPQ